MKQVAEILTIQFWKSALSKPVEWGSIRHKKPNKVIDNSAKYIQANFQKKSTS
jgi:hypothetical protein